MGGLRSHKYNNNRCLVDPGSGTTPTLQSCDLARQNKLHLDWDFKQVRPSEGFQFDTLVDT